MNQYTEIIRKSRYFDTYWYQHMYEVEGDPAQHYLEVGWKRGYNPSKFFRTEEYLALNPDVSEAQMNPLLHYELFGIVEGRFISCDDFCIAPDVPVSVHLAHGRWPEYLKGLYDKEGAEILEVGSRVVTGANFRGLFTKAHYTGFDIYDGPNVDVVGDAHKLSTYFNKQFDLIFSSAVFEHLAMPWIAANEMISLTKIGGAIFVETHYSYASHERPWHFFQFSEQALKVLFSEAHGIECIEAGVSNPIVSRFSNKSAVYLRNQFIRGIYCHSEFLGKKVKEVSEFSYENIELEQIVNGSKYPAPER